MRNGLDGIHGVDHHGGIRPDFTDFDGRRVLFLQMVYGKLQRITGVKNFLQNQHMPPFDICGHVLPHQHLAGGIGAGVGGQPHKVHLAGHLDLAHHVGISLMATANALFDDCMVRRFMSDPHMRCAAELLEEKIPVDAAVRRVRSKPHKQKKHVRS